MHQLNAELPEDEPEQANLHRITAINTQGVNFTSYHIQYNSTDGMDDVLKASVNLFSSSKETSFFIKIFPVPNLLYRYVEEIVLKMASDVIKRRSEGDKRVTKSGKQINF